MTDQELLEKFSRDKDNRWLGIILERYTLLLFGVCMKYLKNEEEARDSVQQVFLKAITELHKYRVEYMKSWLYMVAKNHCLMKLREKSGQREVEIREEMLSAAPDYSGEATHQEKDRTLNLMNESLMELQYEQRTCLTLFYLDKKTYQEVAEQTGFTLMQVKSYIQNGKRNLRIQLEKKL